MIRNRPDRRATTALWPLVLALAACGDAVAPVTFDAPVDLVLEWRTASPEATGMDAAVLERAADQAQAIARMQSLVVIRRGRLVLERYFHGAQATDLADVRSVTKSVVSTLAGIAIERGDLTGLDQTLGELLEGSGAELDPWEREVTVRDLLTMSGGWEWHESGAVGYNEWLLSPDHVAYLLARPKSTEPGSTFEYNTAAVHLLGVALEQAVGQSLPRFADDVLFGPLGITERAWEPLENGHVNGGAGLDLTPRDLARLGQLFLQDGYSGGRRILPEGWVAQATTRHYLWLSDAGPTRTSYGYLWWTDEDNAAFMAWGYGGQFVYVAPSRSLVVVATTNWRAVDGQGIPANLSTQVLSVVVNGVLPAAPPQ